MKTLGFSFQGTEDPNWASFCAHSYQEVVETSIGDC
jgi:hypothetical protein